MVVVVGAVGRLKRGRRRRGLHGIVGGDGRRSGQVAVEHAIDAVLEVVQRLGELVGALIAEVAQRIGRQDRVRDLPDLVGGGEVDPASPHGPCDLPQPLGGGRDIRR